MEKVNKKLVFSLAFFVLISAAAVYAADTTPFTSTFKFVEDNLGYIFVKFSDHVDVSFYIWMKFMLWIFLFAVFYALASIGPVAQNLLRTRNLRVVVALIISLISVVMLPDAIVDAIAKTYGVVAAFIFIGLPVIGITYLIYWAFPTGGEVEVGKRRINHIMKAVLFYLLATIITNFLLAIAKTPTWATLPAGWHEWGGFAEGICSLLMLYHIFAAIFTSAGEEGGGGGGWNWPGRGPQPPQPPRPPYPAHLIPFIDQIEHLIARLYGDFTEYHEIGDRVLTANNAGQPLNAADNQRMIELVNSFGSTMDQINQNQTNLVSNPDFNNLSAAARMRVARLLTRATIINIHITSYQNSFFIDYNNGVRSTWAPPIPIPPI